MGHGAEMVQTENMVYTSSLPLAPLKGGSDGGDAAGDIGETPDFIRV